MKKFKVWVLLMAVVFSMTACGGQKTSTESNTQTEQESSTAKETITESNADEESGKTEASDDGNAQAGSIEECNNLLNEELNSTLDAMNVELEQLITDIDSYEKYKENTERIEAYYENLLTETRGLCITMREYSVAYADIILNSGEDKDDMYDDCDAIFDDIYDDAADEIYDTIYDDLFDDLYDAFYSGVLHDGYDSKHYEEWSTLCSDEYDLWSDTKSDVYDEWSDLKSDVYDFWSDVKSEVWSEDMERAEEKIEKFKKDIEKLKNRESQENVTEKETPDTGVEDDTKEGADTQKNEDVSDEIRPEFQEAMDSYEAFYDEYCDFMKEYYKNPTDTKLLSKYAQMAEKLGEMNEKFEAWEYEDMNTAEQKYYIEVNSRVMQKLADVIQQ